MILAQKMLIKDSLLVGFFYMKATNVSLSE